MVINQRYILLLFAIDFPTINERTGILMWCDFMYYYVPQPIFK